MADETDKGALLEEIKTALRVTSTVYDAEVTALIEAAKADMRRVGIDETLLDESSIDPLCKAAVMLYCKARFGYDNDEAERFGKSYQQMLKDMRNAPTTYGGDSQ